MTWLLPFLATLFAATGGMLATDRLERFAHEDFPPRGRFVEVDGWRTHLLDRGHGPVVVFLHGIGGTTDVWADTLLDAVVTSGHRVIVVDRPGHGHSERPAGMRGDPREQAAFLASTLDELQVETPVGLVGQSWGGGVAAAFALLYPDRVDQIVFIAPYLHPGHQAFQPTYDLAKPRFISDLVLETVAVPFSGIPRKVFAEKMFYPDPIPELWLDAPVLLSQTPKGIRTSAADMRMIGPALEAMSRRYHEIDCPVTVVLGVDDQVVDPTPTMGLALTEGWRLVALKHTGHGVQYVEPDTVIAELRRAFGG